MSAGTVKSLSRGLDVLLAVAALEEAATATEIAEHLADEVHWAVDNTEN
ncbi:MULTISPECIES: hypothetical protein [unclassified Streptomyces]